MFFIIALCLVTLVPRVGATSVYLDENYPGLTPRLYAPGQVSRADRFRQNFTMTRDGNEVLFTETTGADWDYRAIVRLKRDAQGHVSEDVPPALRDPKFEHRPFIGEPCLSPDGNTLLFVGDFPPDIWMCRRTGGGEWGAPVKLGGGVNSPEAEWYPSLAADGTLFFCSKRSGQPLWYQADPTADGWGNVRLLDAPFNRNSGGDLAVSPDGTCVVYQAMRPGNAGEGDLYASFREANGRWSAEISLGASVNTAGFDFGPSFSPDGKYLFFSRRDKWQAATSSAIYWVSTELLRSLKPAALGKVTLANRG